MLLNQRRADAYMHRHGLDALIATSPVNVTYFTGYYCWLDSAFKKYMGTPGGSSDPMMETYALLPRGGKPCLIVSALFAVNAEGLDCEVYGYGEPGYDLAPIAGFPPDRVRDSFSELTGGGRSSSPAKALAEAVGALGLSQSRIGLEREHLPSRVAGEFNAVLPGAVLLDCSNLIRLVRTVKSEEELRRLRTAAEINEKAAQSAFTLADPGTSISTLRAEYTRVVQQNGARFEHFAYGFGGYGIATEPDFILKASDVLYIDFGCVWNHYLSDSGTTLSVSKPPGALAERHRRLRESVEAGKQMLKPGALPSVIQSAMARVLDAHGIISFPHGHGLGLEPRDYPIIVPDSGLRIRDECLDEPADLPIEAGMVLNFESGIFMPGVASLHTEESVLVTEHGWEALVPHDRSSPVLAGHPIVKPE